MLFSNHPVDSLSIGLLDQARGRVVAGEGASFVLLVPTRERARTIVAQLVKAKAGGAVGGLSVTTLTDFATRLLEVAAPNVRVISEAEMALFLELAILRLLKEDKLKYFEGKRAIEHGLPIPPGTFEQIQNTIRRLRERDVTPDSLAEAVGRSSKRGRRATEVNRGNDILAIYNAYLEQLGETATDTYGQFRFLLEYLEKSPEKMSLATCLNEAYPDVNDIFLQGFLRIEGSSLLLLRELTEIVGLTLEIEKHPHNPELFGPLKRLEDSLFEAGVVFGSTSNSRSAPEVHSIDPALGSMEELADLLGSGLFVTNPKEVSEDRPSAEKLVRAAHAQSREQEVEWIARQIKTILEQDSVARAEPSRICVASHLEREYTSLFREAFERYGIPASVTDRDRLENAPLATALVAFLGLAANGFSRRELRRVLSSPYLVFKDSTGALIDKVNVLEVADRERLTGSYKQWLDRIDSRILELQEAFDEFLSESDDTGAEQTLRTIAALKKATKDIAVIEANIAPFYRPLQPAEFLRKVAQLLGKLGVAKAMLRNSELTIKLRTLETETRGFGALRKLLESLTDLFSRLELDQSLLTVEFYLERLQIAAQLERFTPRFLPGSVTVTSLSQALAMEYDYLFIPGLIDGSFPSQYEPKVFLMSEFQDCDDQNQLEEERLLFFTTASRAKKNLFLSWASHSDSGSAQAPSPFVVALRSVVDVNEVTVEQSALQLYSYRDLYAFAGSSFLRTGEDIERWRTEVDAHVDDPIRYSALFTFAPVATLIEFARFKTPFSSYSGVIAAEGLKENELSALNRFRDQTWSISQLETYASCPFKFLVEKVYRLNVSEESSDGLDRRDQGSIVHKVLYQLFTDRNSNKPGLPISEVNSDSERAEVLTEARRITASYLPKLDSGHPFYRLDAERAFGEIRGVGIWKRMLDAEQMLKEGSHRPSFFEVSFGGKTGSDRQQDQLLSRPEAIEIKGIKLRGKIDRIDMDPATFSIVDYKTGGKKSFRDIARGTNLQLPIYLQAASLLLKEYNLANGLPEQQGVAALYATLNDGKRQLGFALKSSRGVEIGKINSTAGWREASEFEALLTSTVAKIETYIEQMSEGKFPLVAKDLAAKSCSYCGFSNACRKRESEAHNTLPEAP